MISTLNENSKETVEMAITKKVGKKIPCLLINIRLKFFKDVNGNIISHASKFVLR